MPSISEYQFNDGPIRFCTKEDYHKNSWYWGAISPEFAERQLRGKPDTTFLVRASRTRKNIVRVCVVMHSDILHIQFRSDFLHRLGIFTLKGLGPPLPLPPIGPTGEYTMSPISALPIWAILMSNNSYAIEHPYLKIPLSRNYRVFSLRHILRYKIRTKWSLDKIEKLEISNELKYYLCEDEIYVELSDDESFNDESF